MDKRPISGDIKAEHSGKDQHREWNTEYQVWLHPHDCILKLGGKLWLVNVRPLAQ